LESVGATEKTVDVEYDHYTKNFNDMMDDMNECGACITSTLLKQKNFFEEAVELAESLVRIYDKSATPDYWPKDVTQKLELGGAATRYRDALKEIHVSYRSSVAKCCSEITLQPIRSAVTAMGPEIEKETSECATICKDYDSYQRRLKVFKSKLEASIGKPNEDEAKAEVEKFEHKVTTARASYEAQNAKVKTDITSAKRAFDAMVEMELISMLVSQQALFQHSADILGGLLADLPQDKVAQVNKRLHEYVKQGGVQVQVEEKSQAEKMVDVALGKAKKGTLKDKTSETIQEQEAAKLAELEKAKAIVREEPSTDVSLKPFQSSQPPPPQPPQVTSSVPPLVPVTKAPPPPPPPPSAPPPPKKKKLVVALFDHEAEEVDELGFVVGDKIEVLDDSDAGWWEGLSLTSGKKGIFPSNYVEKTE